MKINSLKLVTVATVFLASLGFLMFKNSTAPAVRANQDDVAKVYKKKCAMCHKPKAEKWFDPEKDVEHHTEIILKGNDATMPKMPGYESKGMTEDEAKALAEYMLALRADDGSDDPAGK